jgi:hypothetical protein
MEDEGDDLGVGFDFEACQRPADRDLEATPSSRAPRIPKALALCNCFGWVGAAVLATL